MPVETELVVQPRGGGEYLEEFPAEIISYGYRLNRPGTIEFTLPVLPHKINRASIREGVHEAVVVRNRAVVWCGPVLTITEDEKKLTVRGEGLMSYLRRWHVTSTLKYTNTDQFAIARALINHHQSKGGGDFGIDTSGAESSGVPRDRSYPGYELKNIYDALIQLSEVEGGFDFDFDPATRRFVPYYPKRGQRNTATVFDDRNIKSYQRDRDGTSQASQVYAVGEGEGDGMLIANRQSSTAVNTYGLTQSTIAHKDITKQSTLLNHAQRALDETSFVPNLISITASTRDPQLFSYQLGDEVKIEWDSPYDPVDEYQRIIGADVKWEGGEESVVLHTEPL